MLGCSMILVSGLMSFSATAASSGDWPMWGYDAARSGAAPAAVELPETLHLQWVRELPLPRRAWHKQMDDGDKLEFDLSYSPVVMRNRIFVASMTTDRLTAYAADTGEELWRFYADGPARVAPAAWEGKVYFVSDDGRLYCLDAATGALRWKFDAAPAGHRVLGSERVISMWPARGGPVVDEGTIYFASGIWPFLGTFVYALDAETGEVRWANTGHATEWQAQPHGGAYAFAGLAPQGYLAVAGDRLVVSGGRSLPGLFDRRDGTLLDSKVRAKAHGGYRVQIEGDSYFNHGRRYRLSDGGDAGLYGERVGSPYVSMPDGVYVRYKTRVFRLNPDTGDTQAEFKLPVGENRRDVPDWGHISIWDDLLMVTSGPHVFREDSPDRRLASMADIRSPDFRATSSSTLLVYNRDTGDVRWSREAEVGFRHNAVVSGEGTVFVIDGLSEQAVALLQRRGAKPGKPALVALDARTGEQKWETSSDVFGTWLGYSEAFDVLIEAGRYGGLRELPDEPRNRIRVYRGSDGTVLWDRAMGYTGPIAIHGNTLLTAVYWRDTGKPHEMSAKQEGRRLELLTGDDVMRQHPLTGESMPWTYWRTYGCNTANVSKHLITFRSGAAGFADLEHDGGTGTFGGFRAGCTANMVAADGVLLAPDYTRTCTCSYQNQTSLGLIHMPEIELWTANRVGRASRNVQRLGINLGAPGNRRAEDGTLWVQATRF